MLSLGACASGSGAPPPPAPLAEDREQPVLALFEHVLTGFFAGAGPDAPTTCARFSPTPLEAGRASEGSRFADPERTPFPTCFVCGPRPDGLSLWVGPVEGAPGYGVFRL